MRAARAILAFLLLALAAAPSAQASYDPLGSGSTKLSFDRAFLETLKQNGVQLQAKSPARLVAGAVVLPVSGGKMDPTNGKGTIEQSGTLVFKRGQRSLPFKKLTLKTKRSPIQAKVGGSQLKVAQGASISSRRAGFGTKFTATGLALTAKAATRLNKKLHLGRTFAAGQAIGSLRSNAQPATVAILPRGRVTLVPDPAIVAKLNGLFVSLNPISPAELAPGPLFTLPIVPGGELAPDASSGTLRTGGAIELLQQGAGQLFGHELWLDLGAATVSAEVDIQPTPAFPGKLGRIGILDLKMAAGGAATNPGARTIALSAVPVALQAQTAAYFNQAFAGGKATFSAAEPFGTLSFSARGQ